MNKIVWVMGMSAAGKETFIKYAVANPDSMLLKQLEYMNKIIPLIENGTSCERIKIKDTVINLLEKEKEAVILIKWQAIDSIYGDTLQKLAIETPDIPREIILLSSESDVLYARVQKKVWWNNPDDPYSYYTQEMQEEGVILIKNHVKELSAFGFKIIEIDSTDEYKFIESVN